MTKAGEGEGRYQEQTSTGYHRDLEKNVSRFLRALDLYEIEKEEDKRAALKAVMTESLELMESAVKEIPRDGIRKQFTFIEKDYRIYIANENIDNLLVLKEDVSSLRANNKYP